MARLARGTPCRAASNGAGLASTRLSPVLDVEEPTSHRTAANASRRPRIDSRNVHSEPALGCTSNLWRAPEVGNLSKSIDHRQIHAQAATAAVANVADLSHESCKPDQGRRSVRRADAHVPAALRTCPARARPSTNHACGGDRASNRRLDGATASQCLFQRTKCRDISFMIAI